MQWGNILSHSLGDNLSRQECIKLAAINKPEYRFSYLKTKDDAEIDLVVERPGLPLLLIEIKSGNHVGREELGTLIKFSEELNAEGICLSTEHKAKKYESILLYPWEEGIKKYFS